MKVVGVASDNEQVVSIGIVLQDPLNNEIVGSATTTTDEQGRFSVPLVLGDRYTHTGDYILRATAYDGAGNPSSDFVSIVLQESPTFYYKTLVAAENGTSTRIYAIDTFNQYVPGPVIGDEMAVLSVDSRAQQIVFGNPEGPLYVVEASAYGTQYEVELPAGPFPKALTAFASYQRDYFVGNSNFPYIQSYSHQGASQFEFQAQYAPVALLAIEDGLYASSQDINGQVIKVDRYNRDNGQLQQSETLNWLPTLLRELDNSHILAAGTENGAGKVALLDKQTLTVVAEELLPEPVRDVTVVDGHAYILTAVGVQVYNPAYTNMSSPMITGAFTALDYEPISGLLYLGHNAGVKSFDLLGTEQGTYPGPFGQVMGLRHHHSK